MPQPNSILVPCPTCHTLFQTWPGKIRKGEGKFCSKDCSHAGRSRAFVVPLETRLFEGVDRVEEGCWLRLHDINPVSGYSQINIKKKTTVAHRAALSLALGYPIPTGFKALHTCDVRPCIRNDEPGIYVVRGVAHPRFGHLWLGTQADNVADMVEKGRGPIGDKNGSHTHPENRPRGEMYVSSKLTDQIVREIRQRYVRRHVTLAHLAREYGVSFQLVSAVVHRKVWTHVD